MTVGDLLPRLSGVVAPAGGLGADVRDRAVTAIAYDSPRATAGAIFVAVSGQRFDGAAVAAGGGGVAAARCVGVILRSGAAAERNLVFLFHGGRKNEKKVPGSPRDVLIFS